jgi:CRISPR system Cascade subunit CasE
MIQISPKMDRVVRWAHEQRVLARRGSDDMGYAWHSLLTAAFGDKAPKPFHLLEQRGRPAQILAYSENSASEMRNFAALFADPIVVDALGVLEIASKEMPTAFQAGSRFGFELRVRPTIRVTKDGKTRERDAFLAALSQVEPDQGLDRGTVYTQWLREKLKAGGADLVSAEISRFQMSRIVRRNRSEDISKLQELIGPDVTFNGTLVVQDPEAFHLLLSRGVGRHRAFGFGMLLLRPST